MKSFLNDNQLTGCIPEAVSGNSSTGHKDKREVLNRPALPPKFFRPPLKIL